MILALFCTYNIHEYNLKKLNKKFTQLGNKLDSSRQKAL